MIIFISLLTVVLILSVIVVTITVRMYKHLACNVSENSETSGFLNPQLCLYLFC